MLPKRIAQAFSPVQVPAVCTVVIVILACILLLQSLHLQAVKKKTITFEIVDIFARQKKDPQHLIQLQAESHNKNVSSIQKAPQRIQTARSTAFKTEDPIGPSLTDGEIAAFSQILQMRIAQAEVDQRIVSNKTCAVLAQQNNVRGPCVNTTCPRKFDPSPEVRIRQLLAPQLRLTSQQREFVRKIAMDVKPMKYIFVTAASSNHYKESQALVNNLRQFLFNRLHPNDYIFYYFDLGLTQLERSRVIKNCNCTVKTISFADFPQHTKTLMCYAWKPLIIKAFLPKANILVYMDTSVRFQPMDLDKFFAAARYWGAQFLVQHDSIPNHTWESMFAFYGDIPCMYSPFPELLAGFSVFHNEPFMNKVIVDPWVACALNKSCMCPMENPNSGRLCAHKERIVGQCHRFDLSALTIQFAKLYGIKFGHLVMQTNNPPLLRRNEVMDFFTD